MANNMFIAPQQGHFKARSFDDYTKPLTIYKEAFDKRADEYAALMDATTSLQDKIQGEGNEQARALYNKYYNGLSAVTDDLMTQGLNQNTLSNALAIRNRFNTEIKPINDALTLLKDSRDAYDADLAKDSTSMHAFNPYEMKGIDNLLYKTSLPNKKLSGAELRAEISNMAKNVAKGAINDPAKWKSIIGGQYYEQMKQNGFTVEEIQKYLDDPNNQDAKFNILTNMMNYVAEARGLNPSEWSEDILNKARNYMSQGLYDAIGDVQYRQLENWKLKQDLANRARQQAMTQNTAQTFHIDPRKMYTAIKSRADKKQKAALEMAEQYNKYFKRDENGNIVGLTKEGNDVLNHGRLIHDHRSTSTYSSKKEDIEAADFYRAFKSTAMPWYNFLKPDTNNDFNQYIPNLNTSLEGVHDNGDALSQTYFAYTPASKDEKDVIKRLDSMADHVFYDASWDNQNGGFKLGNDKIAYEDIFNSDSRIGDISFGYNGDVVFDYIDGDGEYHTVGFNSSSTDLAQVKENAAAAKQAQQEFLRIKNDSTIPEDQKAARLKECQDAYVTKIQEAYRWLGNGLGTNTTQYQQFSQFGDYYFQ